MNKDKIMCNIAPFRRYTALLCSTTFYLLHFYSPPSHLPQGSHGTSGERLKDAQPLTLRRPGLHPLLHPQLQVCLGPLPRWRRRRLEQQMPFSWLLKQPTVDWSQLISGISGGEKKTQNGDAEFIIGAISKNYSVSLSGCTHYFPRTSSRLHLSWGGRSFFLEAQTSAVQSNCSVRPCSSSSSQAFHCPAMWRKALVLSGLMLPLCRSFLSNSLEAESLSTERIPNQISLYSRLPELLAQNHTALQHAGVYANILSSLHSTLLLFFSPSLDSLSSSALHPSSNTSRNTSACSVFSLKKRKRGTVEEFLLCRLVWCAVMKGHGDREPY